MGVETIIVFSPHPDDETIGMGGTIAKEAENGNRVIVVMMTDGRHAFSTMGINSSPSPEELKEIRKDEARKALGILGVCAESVLFLDFEDGDLEKNEQLAEAKILDLLKANRPSKVYSAHEKDAHADHRATYRISLNAIKRSGLRSEIFLYSILQSDSKVGRGVRFISNNLHKRIIRNKISDFIDLKKAAISEYKSQTTVFSGSQENPIITTVGIENHLRDYEIFYRINKRNF
jgi:LmbE family N-acetylglucosaminyl deacetylase